MEQKDVESPDKGIDATGASNPKLHGRIQSMTNTHVTCKRPLTFARVSELICSQDDDPGTSKSPRESQLETGISRSIVRRIAKDDLKLKIFR